MQLHASAAGRVMLAYGPEALREKVFGTGRLERFTPATEIDPKKIRKELAEIPERGYSVNRGERELEVAAVAAPIFDHENKVNAALSVVGPVQRFSSERIPDIAKRLMDVTRKISVLLGATV